jgi:hypothetical protein
MSQVTAYPDLVSGFLRDRFGLVRGAEKRLARKAGCSPRTVENWMRGESAPAGEHLLNLMAECDELAAAIMAEVRRRKAVSTP